jgi:hypothetical protein
MSVRRTLSQEEIDGLVAEWNTAKAHGEHVEPLQHYLGFTEDEYARWTQTGTPPYQPSI